MQHTSMLLPAEEGGNPKSSGIPVPVPDIDGFGGLSTDTQVLLGARGECLGGPMKRPKSGVEGSPHSSNSLATEARASPSSSTTASEVTYGTAMDERTAEAAASGAAARAASEATAEAKGAAASGPAAAAPEGEVLSRNRINSGRHGKRIACPMDSSHSIYAQRLQAHLKKCTKARDIAFSHCLPFMQPGANLPQRQKPDNPEEQQQQQQEHSQQQHQQQHENYVDSPEIAAALTSEFEAKITDAYRYALSYLKNNPPIEAVAAATTAARAPATTKAVAAGLAPWEPLGKLPASLFISNCCSRGIEGGDSKSEEEPLLLLRAAADACKVPLDTGTAATKGPPLASVEADLKNALLVPQQDRSAALLQVLQHLQKRFNKHQKQLLQLLALCLLHNHLHYSSIDETLIVELGAGESSAPPSLASLCIPLHVHPSDDADVNLLTELYPSIEKTRSCRALCVSIFMHM